MYSYSERLHRLNLQSLELRRLLTDLVWCYKVVFGMVNINIVWATFFSERVINVWNSLPKGVDFSSLLRFKTLSNVLIFLVL